LAPLTIQEYQRQLVAFARWMETMLDVPVLPEASTSYRVEQYVATLELQVRGKARKPATLNKAVAALSALGAWLVETGACVPWQSSRGHPKRSPSPS
jgi:site-specific recombinase XerC